MSQLHREQVVGRGLGRRDYEIGEDGELTEEVAKILGVPVGAENHVTRSYPASHQRTGAVSSTFGCADCSRRGTVRP
jgi:hypothetical protein